jgi:NADPH2:quinone reductase
LNAADKIPSPYRKDVMEAAPTTMRAVTLNRFGGPEVLESQHVPVPELDADEVLIRLEIAGLGEWDAFEREGGYAEMLGTEPTFPYILGSEGSGRVAAVGAGVKDFHPGEAVYASAFLNPKGGFYAEYVAVKTEQVSLIPEGMTAKQAGVMSGVALTALRGLEDTLRLGAGEGFAIVGASGGMGHLAMQLAKRLGARVIAVASGEDGVALTKRLGADHALDGRKDDVVSTILTFLPEGLDAALLLAGGETAEAVRETLREGGRAAWPHGIHPEPEARAGSELLTFNGGFDRDLFARFKGLTEQRPLEVHVGRVFPLSQAAAAQEALKAHHLGKFALRIGGENP